MRLVYIFSLVFAFGVVKAQDNHMVITTSNQNTPKPLYVIDDVVTKDVSALSGVNPNDIESIEILKDANSTAVYGNDGVNGVIVVKTQKYVKRKTLNKLAEFSAKLQRYLKHKSDTASFRYLINGRQPADSARQTPGTVFSLPKSAIKSVEFKKPKTGEKAIVKITTKP
ncbi:TonB-dependent receptor plug domain-containing protein [Mucilaginibacter sp. PAMB04168]|uniref:TonB-dependent receptor plug domain-containing protein n=1 Tax=Mucilaginibacter sp. PAMB04168 TaxID=3138567 RepID=UPI0031F6093B